MAQKSVALYQTVALLLRRNRITGWRRQAQIRGRAVLPRGPNVKAARQRRPTLPKAGAHGGPSRTGNSRPAFRVRPDFVFTRLKLAVFVDGCFWHGCPKHCNQPSNNRAFWRRKLSANKARDAFVTRTLKRAGWRVLRVWEHKLARRNHPRLLRRIHKSLTSPSGAKGSVSTPHLIRPAVTFSPEQRRNLSPRAAGAERETICVPLWQSNFDTSPRPSR